ncbi:phosphate regulon transcriptional regulator PhoB [Acidovorax sp. LjRoot66]|uniref:phosphate regulon transcriptional regulator PhoB n=1 Tax=Acidovorax sp. LjRoot66 TaxID=3342334 RepID=UPI003ECF5F43
MRLLPRVLIVEDEPAIAELISINLRHNGFTPCCVEDGESAQRELDIELPDVILLDWVLPGESGLLFARKWRAAPRTRRVPIVMLTARGDEWDKVTALDAGADDYMTKPFSTQELLARIRAVMRRNMFDPGREKVTIGQLTLDAATHRVTFNAQELELGPREFKLLRYLMTHAERIHTRSHLLDMVWSENVLIEERTVDTHVKRLRDALGDAGAMIETVRGAGYRLIANSQPSS